MENDYRITKLHGTFIGDNRIPDLPVGEKTKIFSSTNGKTAWVDLPEGGKSVPPCLNLMDMDTVEVRTSITEEEKKNLENGLYNSVLYADLSLGPVADNSVFFPEPLVQIENMYIFSFYTFSFDETTQKVSIDGTITKNIQVGEKNADGTYKITVNDEFNKAIPFGSGGGGGSSVDNYLVKDIVDDSVTLTNDEFKKLAESNCTLVLRRTRLNNTYYYISSLKLISSNNDGAVSEIKVNAFVLTNIGSLSISESYILTFTPDSLTSSVEKTTISTSPAKLFNKFNILTNDFELNNILPCSTADNGKALSVVNGEAKWADLGTTYSKARYEHTLTIKNSAGKILWTQTMRNSSNTIVNSYANLKTLFGEATYAGFGEYCQLDLRGGTEATDKLIKADGTEATLESLGAIVYTDVCFLPK